MEHKLITGGEQFLPFARSRIKALRATGLKYASQQFEIDGCSVKVRIEPGHEYISLSGGDVFGWSMIPLSGFFMGDPEGSAPFGYVANPDSTSQPPEQIPLTQEMYTETNTLKEVANAVYITDKLKVKEESLHIAGDYFWSDGKKERILFGSGCISYKQKLVNISGTSDMLSGAIAKSGDRRWLLVASPSGGVTKFFAVSMGEIVAAKVGSQSVLGVLIGSAPSVEGGLIWRFSSDGLRAIALESKTLDRHLASNDGRLVESEFLKYEDGSKSSITGVQHIHRAVFSGAPDAKPGEPPFTVSFAKETRKNAVLKCVPTATFTMGSAVKSFSTSPSYCEGVSFSNRYEIRHGVDPAELTTSSFDVEGIYPQQFFKRFPFGAVKEQAAVESMGSVRQIGSQPCYFNFVNFPLVNSVEAEEATETPYFSHAGVSTKPRVINSSDVEGPPGNKVYLYEFNLKPAEGPDGSGGGYMASRGFVYSGLCASDVKYELYENRLVWAGFVERSYHKPIYNTTVITPIHTIAGSPAKPADADDEVVAMLHAYDGLPSEPRYITPFEILKTRVSDHVLRVTRSADGVLVHPTDGVTPIYSGELNTRFSLGSLVAMASNKVSSYSHPESANPNWAGRFDENNSGTPQVDWPTFKVQTSCGVFFDNITILYKFPYFLKRAVNWARKTTFHYEGARILAVGYRTDGGESILEVKGRPDDKVVYSSTERTYEPDPMQTEGSTSVEMNFEHTVGGSCGYDLVLDGVVLTSHRITAEASRVAPLEWVGAVRPPVVEKSEVKADSFVVEDYDLSCGLVLTQESSRKYTQKYGTFADKGVVEADGEVTTLYSSGGAGRELFRGAARTGSSVAMPRLEQSTFSKVITSFGFTDQLTAWECPPISGVQYLRDDSLSTTREKFSGQFGMQLNDPPGWYNEQGRSWAYGQWVERERVVSKLGPQDADSVVFPEIPDGGGAPIKRRLFALSSGKWLVHISQFGSPDKGVFSDGSSLLDKFSYIDTAKAKFDQISFIA